MVVSAAAVPAMASDATQRKMSRVDSRKLRRTVPAELRRGFEAAAAGREQELSELLSSDPGFFTATSEVDTRTLLHAACFAGQARCVRVLLGAGALVEQRMRGGITPLIAAAQSGSVECVQILVAARADIYAVAMGKTALQHAQTLAQGARTEEGGWTAVAATLAYAEKAQALREESALFDRQAEALQ